jgi:L-threonylcarbamoyladenylate synthase
MKTEIFDVSHLNNETLDRARVYGDAEARRLTEEAFGRVEQAARIIRKGGLVAFPTETVYGLGADAFCEAAVKRIYAAKGRPSDNPMIVHIARASDISALTPDLFPGLVKLIDAFWPGPLTLVLKKLPAVPAVTTGGLNTVAVRIPDDPAAIELIRRAGCPVAAPSANISGRPSPTKAEHVVMDLDGKIDAILAGGACRVGIESTVLDLTAEMPTILRPGVVTGEQIEDVIGKKVAMDPSLLSRRARGGKAPSDAETADGKGGPSPKSPGMKYKHYAPRARMIVIEGRRDRTQKEIERLRALNERLGLRVGVLMFEEKAFIEAAHRFFADLREIDASGVDLILAGALSDQDGVGFAVMNRMMKSAGYNIARV